MFAQLLATYQHTSMVILPMLGILWGLTFARYQQESRFVPSLVREAFVIATIGRPVWKRVYQDIVFR